MYQQIKSIGIVGGGKMGLNLFHFLSAYDFELCLCVRKNPDSILQKHERKLNRQLKNNLLTQFEYQQKIKTQTIGTDLNSLSNADLIIECITEDLQEKNILWQNLDKLAKPEAIFASNSSSITPEKFQVSASRAKNMVGIHFIYPIEFKKIVELVHSTQTSEATLSAVIDFLKSINKTYLKQNLQSAFILNIILFNLQSEAYNLSQKENITFQLIDEAVKEYFLPMGIFELMDHIGLDVLLHSCKNYLTNFKEKETYLPLINKLQHVVGEGSLGLKTGKGFFDYANISTPANFKTNLDKQKIGSYLESIYTNTLTQYSKIDNITQIELESAMKEYLSF